ncbi:FRG domain-containing protein [Aeromonas sanarellii]|uniref:FRG domain-containing protein n=1 Tax=Aeromonas sanarellii TaxID=633415 RepID=UPI00399F9E6B
MSKSIGALSTFLKKIKQIQPQKDHTLFFRGHADVDYIDMPSIYRFHPKNNIIRPYILEEDILFRKIIMACPGDFKNDKSTFDQLVRMQHYGLPTRLLDITSNPLVALYFSCIDKRGKGGKIGQVIVYEVPNDRIKFYSSDTVSVIANIAKRPNDIVISKFKNYEKEDLLADKEYNRLIHEIQEEKPYFKREIKLSHLESVVCVQPKLDNKRIIKQSGAFFLFGINENKLEPATIPDDFYKLDTVGNKINILISNNHKNKILDELESLSISNATLFPEIDNVSKFLKTQIENKIS